MSAPYSLPCEKKRDALTSSRCTPWSLSVILKHLDARRRRTGFISALKDRSQQRVSKGKDDGARGRSRQRQRKYRDTTLAHPSRTGHIPRFLEGSPPTRPSGRAITPTLTPGHCGKTKGGGGGICPSLCGKKIPGTSTSATNTCRGRKDCLQSVPMLRRVVTQNV